ncbi:transcriptional regulator [Bacillus salipaludis]|uniref:Transcriptional regulator n=1 Tax=Bacillus salipaludis TaxID=2547811 RepID=A0ABW8RGB4_9BACI
MEFIEEALKLDEKQELFWFIQLYNDRMKRRNSEHILLKENDSNRKMVSLREVDSIKEEAIDGKCVVLDLTTSDYYFYGINDAVKLEQKQAEMLGYLIDHQMRTCSKSGIEKAIWLNQGVGKTTVRRYISAIRVKLTQAMGRNDISENILVTANGGYVWRADIVAKVLRKG